MGWQRPEDEPKVMCYVPWERPGMRFTGAITSGHRGGGGSITEKFEGASPVCSVLLSLSIPLPTIWQGDLGISPLFRVGYGFSSESP